MFPKSGNAPDEYDVKITNLFPEDTTYDRNANLFYQSNLWKGRISVTDPSKDSHFNVLIPGVSSSGNGEQQLAGLSLSSRSNADRLYAVAKDSRAFDFGNQRKNGACSFHAFDLPLSENSKPVYSVYFDSVQKALHKKFGFARPFGPVDSAQDAEGNSYIVFALGMPAIAKISKDGRNVEAWSAEKPNGSQRPGYTGVQYVSSANMIIAYGGPRPLTAFDLSSSTPSKPIAVNIQGDFGTLSGTEKLTMVPSITAGGGPRLLGTKAPYIYSFKSTDNWKSASFKTFQRDEFKNNGLTVVTEAGFDGGRQIYGGGAYFNDHGNGDKKEFPIYRIPDDMIA